MDPTEPVDASAVVDATLTDNATVTVTKLVDRVQGTATTLQRLREQQYTNHESVFDVGSSQARSQYLAPNEKPLLRDQQLDAIARSLDARWAYTYRSIIHDERRDGWNGSVPDGRLDWTRAAEACSDLFTVGGSTLVWDADDVSSTYVRGSPGLAFDIGTETTLLSPDIGNNSETLVVETGHDCTAELERHDTVRLEHGEEQRAAGSSPFRVVFVTTGGRRTVPMEDVKPDAADTIRGIEELRRLATEPQGSSLYQSLVDIITRGHLTAADQIRLMLYLSGQQDAILLPYEGPVACFVAHIAAALDAELTHIPQVGHVVLSQEQKSGFESFAESFPEKQHVTAGDMKALGAWLGYPPSVTAHVVDDSTRGGQTMERLAQMYASGQVDDNETLWCQFAGYPLAPDADVVESAVRDGKANWDAVNEFDAQHGTAFAPHIHERMTGSPCLNWRTLR